MPGCATQYSLRRVRLAHHAGGFYVLGHADEGAVEAAEREAAAQREGLVRRGGGAEFVVIEWLLLGLQLAPECGLRRREGLIAPYALILLREHP